MKAVFVDTAGWVACADGADPGHIRCCAARDTALEAGQALVTTDFMIDETLTLLRFRLASPRPKPGGSRSSAAAGCGGNASTPTAPRRRVTCSFSTATKTSRSPTARVSSSCASSG